MYSRRRRKCFCMNNHYNSDCKDMIEDACNDNCSCKSMNYNENCECGFDDITDDVFPENPMLGQSYVPIQYMDKTFKPCVGLKMGTIFPELVSPYFPGQSMEEIKYIEATNKIGEGCNKCR